MQREIEKNILKKSEIEKLAETVELSSQLWPGGKASAFVKQPTKESLTRIVFK
jgi:hypothetical protein